MNVITLAFLLSAFIAFESALTVLRLDRNSRLNRIFFVHATTYVLLALTFALFVTAHERSGAWILNRLTILPACFICVTMFHFSVELTGLGAHPAGVIFTFSSYLASLCLALYVLGGGIITGIRLTPWGWDNVADVSNPMTMVMYLFFMILLLASAIIIIRWGAASGNLREKKQAASISISFLAGVISVICCMTFFVTDDPLYVALSADLSFVMLFTTFILGVRIAIRKYRLMSVNPGMPVAKLIQGMSEAVILADFTGHIIYTNAPAKALIGCPHDIMRSIYDIFTCESQLRDLMEIMSSDHTPSATLPCTIATSGCGGRSRRLALQKISPPDGNGGVMITLRDDPAVDSFREKYGITDRQMEIILMATSGLSNRKIAERLSRSERTVENHLFNIYTRLGIDNRVELINMLHDFGTGPG